MLTPKFPTLLHKVSFRNEMHKWVFSAMKVTYVTHKQEFVTELDLKKKKSKITLYQHNSVLSKG